MSGALSNAASYLPFTGTPLMVGEEKTRQVCLGILLGIRHFEEESATEFRRWAGDVPGEMFTRVLAEFRKGQLDKPSREKFAAYLDEYL